MIADNERNHQPSINEVIAMGIYFVKESLSGFIKIGYYGDNLMSRIRTLKSSNPNPLLILGVIPRADMLYEKNLHNRFIKYNYENEWFYSDVVLENFIQRHSETNNAIQQFNTQQIRLGGDKVRRKLKKWRGLWKNTTNRTTIFATIARMGATSEYWDYQKEVQNEPQMASEKE
jgi:hypothetical protein